jgi:hypothetical protein
VVVDKKIANVNHEEGRNADRRTDGGDAAGTEGMNRISLSGSG